LSRSDCLDQRRTGNMRDDLAYFDHVFLRVVAPALVAFVVGSFVHWTTFQSSTAAVSLVLFANWTATLGQGKLRFDAFDRPWLCRAAVVALAVMLVAAFLGFDPSIAARRLSGRTHFRIISFIVVLLPAIPFAIRTIVDTIAGRDQ